MRSGEWQEDPAQEPRKTPQKKAATTIAIKCRLVLWPMIFGVRNQTSMMTKPRVSHRTRTRRVRGQCAAVGLHDTGLFVSRKKLARVQRTRPSRVTTQNWISLSRRSLIAGRAPISAIVLRNFTGSDWQLPHHNSSRDTVICRNAASYRSSFHR